MDLNSKILNGGDIIRIMDNHNALQENLERKDDAIESVEIGKTRTGEIEHVKISFNCGNFILLDKKEDLFVALGYTHHGCVIPSPKISGRFHKAVEHLRSAFPDWWHDNVFSINNENPLYD